MKVLELFAGTRSIGKAFEKRGHEVYSVDWDKDFENINLYTDISTLTAKEVLEKFGKPDVIWASPDCTTFSVAGISHHRRKNKETGNLDPISEYAKFCDVCDKHIIELIKQLQPTYYFIENPRGGMRNMEWMKDLPRYTVTYCQYGERRMKPTDIWTNHPNPQFKSPCSNGDTCHDPAPRGSKSGTQALKNWIEKSRIPEQLCDHIVDICEQYIEAPRVCDCCKAEMYEGYLIDDREYYCSDDCLHSAYTPKEYEELCEQGLGYWTTWDDPRAYHIPIGWSNLSIDEILEKLK